MAEAAIVAVVEVAGQRIVLGGTAAKLVGLIAARAERINAIAYGQISFDFGPNSVATHTTERW